jgi:hypothetical protein
LVNSGELEAFSQLPRKIVMDAKERDKRTTSTAALGGLIDPNGTSIELNVVHGGDGSLGISFLGVSNESETTATAGVAILDDDLLRTRCISMSLRIGSRDGSAHCLLNGAELLEFLTKSILIGVPRKAASECMLAPDETDMLEWIARCDLPNE